MTIGVYINLCIIICLYTIHVYAINPQTLKSNKPNIQKQIYESQNSKINYTDYRDAMNNTNLIDPSKIKLKNLNLEEYSNERENQDMTLNEQDQLIIDKIKYKEEMRERNRLAKQPNKRPASSGWSYDPLTSTQHNMPLSPQSKRICLPTL